MRSKGSISPITLTPEQARIIQRKYAEKNKLIFAVMLKFFEHYGRFPEQQNIEVKQLMKEMVAYLELDPDLAIPRDEDRNTRSIERFKQEIRFFYGFRLATVADKTAFIEYCKGTIFVSAPTWDQALEDAYQYFKMKKLEPYTYKQLERFLATAHYQFEEELCKNIEQSLSLETKNKLDHLLIPAHNMEASLKKAKQIIDESPVGFVHLKSQRVELKIQSILYQIHKYKHLQSLNIPSLMSVQGTRKLYTKYYDRVLCESPSHIKKHNPCTRYAYLTLFCHIRQQLMADTLTDLLLKLLHRINTKAENFVDKNMKKDHKKVKGKMGTLLVLAQTSKDHPKGVIEKTIYPSVSQERLTEIVGDLGSDHNWYQNLVKEKALSLYSNNNRSMIWALLAVLDFGGDHKRSPILRALNFLKTIYTQENKSALKDRLYDPILIKKLVPQEWEVFIKCAVPLEHPTKVRIHWHAFELALFERLKVELSVKNIWVKHSYRYRNPEEDLPTNFEEKEDYYFDLLNLPKDPKVFIKNIQENLDHK